MSRDRDVVIVDGVRTPFVKLNTDFRDVPAVELGRVVVREAIERSDIDPGELDEVIVGNIAGPPDAANIARVIALHAKIPVHVPAFTVGRNCASGPTATRPWWTGGFGNPSLGKSISPDGQATPGNGSEYGPGGTRKI